MVKENTDLLEDRVSAKLEEGDFRGAVRLACSDDTFADPDATMHHSSIEIQASSCPSRNYFDHHLLIMMIWREFYL